MSLPVINRSPITPVMGAAPFTQDKKDEKYHHRHRRIMLPERMR